MNPLLWLAVLGGGFVAYQVIKEGDTKNTYNNLPMPTGKKNGSGTITTSGVVPYTPDFSMLMPMEPGMGVDPLAEKFMDVMYDVLCDLDKMIAEKDAPFITPPIDVGFLSFPAIQERTRSGTPYKMTMTSRLSLSRSIFAFSNNDITGGRFDISMGTWETPTGYEYLGDVPTSSAARVKAMRDKMNSWVSGNTTVEIVRQMVDGSEANVTNVITKFYSTISSDVDALNKIGASLRLSSATLANYKGDLGKTLTAASANVVAQALGNGNPLLISFLQTAINAATIQIPGIINNVIADITGQLATDIASVIPVVGQVIGALINIIVGIEANNAAKRAAERAEKLRIFSLSFQDQVKKLSSRRWPIPIMAQDQFPDGQAHLTARGYFSALSLLPIDDLVFINRWWAYATTLAADNDVRLALSTMCSDNMGGFLASDEQVMLVAAPIAAAYGFPTDAFAKKLWTYSKGWRSRPDLHRYSLIVEKDPTWPVDSLLETDRALATMAFLPHPGTFTKDYGYGWSGGSTFVVDGRIDENFEFFGRNANIFRWRNLATYNDATKKHDYQIEILKEGSSDWQKAAAAPGVPVNCYIVNLAVLCRDALQLADTFQRLNIKYGAPRNYTLYPVSEGVVTDVPPTVRIDDAGNPVSVTESPVASVVRGFADGSIKGIVAKP